MDEQEQAIRKETNDLLTRVMTKQLEISANLADLKINLQGILTVLEKVVTVTTELAAEHAARQT